MVLEKKIENIRIDEDMAKILSTQTYNIYFVNAENG